MSPQDTANAIMAGELSPSVAFGRPELYPHFATKGGMSLLGSSTKIDLNEGMGYVTSVLYMMPAMSSGREACGGRSKGCTFVCLVKKVGRMDMASPQRARRRKHAAFYADRARFMSDLSAEITAQERRAAKLGKVSAIRLNGTTDIPFERYPVGDAANIMDAHPDTIFYDYTKLALRHRTARGPIPTNYSLTFSVSERADAEMRASEYLDAGYNAAIVFATEKHNLPATYPLGGATRPVVDADLHDARFLDPAGSIAGLYAKGLAKNDDSGFVRAL